MLSAPQGSSEMPAKKQDASAPESYPSTEGPQAPWEREAPSLADSEAPRSD